MEDNRSAFKVLTAKPTEKRHVGRPGYSGINIMLSQDRDY